MLESEKGHQHCVIGACADVLAIDIDENRLGNASVADFEQVIRTLQASGFERLMVRFGYEIFVPHLETAMEQQDAKELLYHKRIFVNLP